MSYSTHSLHTYGKESGGFTAVTVENTIRYNIAGSV